MTHPKTAAEYAQEFIGGWGDDNVRKLAVKFDEAMREARIEGARLKRETLKYMRGMSHRDMVAKIDELLALPVSVTNQE